MTPKYQSRLLAFPCFEQIGMRRCKFLEGYCLGANLASRTLLHWKKLPVIRTDGRRYGITKQLEAEE